MRVFALALTSNAPNSASKLSTINTSAFTKLRIIASSVNVESLLNLLFIFHSNSPPVMKTTDFPAPVS